MVIKCLGMNLDRVRSKALVESRYCHYYILQERLLKIKNFGTLQTGPAKIYFVHITKRLSGFLLLLFDLAESIKVLIDLVL